MRDLITKPTKLINLNNMYVQVRVHTEKIYMYSKVSFRVDTVCFVHYIFALRPSYL